MDMVGFVGITILQAFPPMWLSTSDTLEHVSTYAGLHSRQITADEGHKHNIPTAAAGKDERGAPITVRVNRESMSLCGLQEQMPASRDLPNATEQAATSDKCNTATMTKWDSVETRLGNQITSAYL